MLIHYGNLADYLPAWRDLASLAGVLVAALLLTGLGTLAAGRRALPEVRLVAGWGVLCLVLTAWAVAAPASLRIPAAALGILGLGGLWRGGAGTAGLWRLGVLTVPIWLVMAAARPSQIDTFLNLLPNLGYLYEYGMLPADGRPPHHSFLPGAPYNTQFVGFAASLVAGHLAANAMSLFNIVLQCAAAALLARVLAGMRDADSPPAMTWGAAAGGLLLAILLNPGFVPRTFFAPYGEAPLAVTMMFALWLGVRLVGRAAAGQPLRAEATALALALAAMVNTKQSGGGSMAATLVALLAAGWLHPAVHRLRWLGVLAAAAVPAAVLYAAWRLYVAGAFAGRGELALLPFASWHWSLLPDILLGIVNQIARRAFLFVVLAAMAVAAVVEARKRPRGAAAQALTAAVAAIVAFNGFLLFTYVAHFPAEWSVAGQNYFRYMTQTSLMAVLALAIWLAPSLRDRWMAWPRRGHAAAVAAGLAAAAPILALPLLRFDLYPPQPAVWTLGERVSAALADGDRVALLVPGDTADAGGSMLRGAILFAPPRRHRIDFRTVQAADHAALADAAAAGYGRALVTCTPPGGLGGAPAGAAALLDYDGGAWRPAAVWPWPGDHAGQRWTGLLFRPTFCG
ncbi:MAG: hypothetical protein AB7K86_13145 [Rhodospirillales bacterium]